MDLARVLAKYPGVRLATRDDNEAILKFYQQTALSGKSLKLRSIREPDFFKFLDLHSHDQAVFIYRETADAPIEGLGTIVFREGYWEGRVQKVAYLGDFRVAFNRRVISIWRKAYADVMGELDCPAVTAVIDENLLAQNAFIKQSKGVFQYSELARYEMVNVLKKWPGFLFQKNTITKKATLSDLPLLIQFLNEQNKLKPFGYVFTEESFLRRCQEWSLALEDFFIYLDGDQKILACAAPWSPTPSKYNVVEKIPFYFNFYRPLIKVPKRGTEIKTLYLTHLEVDSSRARGQRAEIFRDLLEKIYQSKMTSGPWHMLSFCDFKINGFANSLGGYLINRIPMRLFSVTHGESTLENSQGLTNREVGFEIALV